MRVGELRALWQDVFSSDPPSAFSKDLLARAIAYRLQEQAYGGLSTSTARLLRSLAKPGAEPPRRVKVGSVIVREHKGVLHEVMVVSGGFCWRGKTYDSLSTIARKITGVVAGVAYGQALRRPREPDDPDLRKQERRALPLLRLSRPVAGGGRLRPDRSLGSRRRRLRSW